jgi:hypothetical protein
VEALIAGPRRILEKSAPGLAPFQAGAIDMAILESARSRTLLTDLGDACAHVVDESARINEFIRN